MKIHGIAHSDESEENLRLATLGRDVAHDGLELREDLGLAQGELRVLVVVVKGGNHVLDLRARGAGYVREARYGGQSRRG